MSKEREETGKTFFYRGYLFKIKDGGFYTISNIVQSGLFSTKSEEINIKRLKQIIDNRIEASKKKRQELDEQVQTAIKKVSHEMLLYLEKLNNENKSNGQSESDD